jgi:hypothetical protein
MRELKVAVQAECRRQLKEKIIGLEDSIIELSDSMENEVKSSLGDKHETSRARMQTQQEQLSRQLAELITQLKELDRLVTVEPSDNSYPGSLVQTNQGYFYIAIPLGKIKVNETDVFVISPRSPLGLVLSGLQNHSEFAINKIMYRILNIY